MTDFLTGHIMAALTPALIAAVTLVYYVVSRRFPGNLGGVG